MFHCNRLTFQYKLTPNTATLDWSGGKLTDQNNRKTYLTWTVFLLLGYKFLFARLLRKQKSYYSRHASRQKSGILSPTFDKLIMQNVTDQIYTRSSLVTRIPSMLNDS